jgi:DNA-binding response OmpR family regulator
MTPEERQTSPCVLVVEDEAGLLELLEMAFQNAGYRVTTADNGVAGWQNFDREHPDLVILDLNIPNMSGFRLLELIRSESEVPVLILTAYDFAEAEEVARYRPNHFMSKPFDVQDLIFQANSLIGRTANGQACD